ncbi:MAG TPA: discoidin domain-containing protein [Puia sp.]|nr:discoidin domain-containing protein [Puia sp.]
MRSESPIGLLLLLSLSCASTIRAQTDVLTQHNDLSRTGWNNQETILTTSNVNANSFGFLYSRPVDDQLFAQPLIATGVNIPGKGTKNVLFACTANNSIYAYDADDGSITSPYWEKNYSPAGFRPALKTDMHPGLCGGYYSDFSSNIGLVGTPVIDKSSGTLYFVTKVVSTDTSLVDNHAWNAGVTNEEYTYTTSGFHQYIHAVDLATGAEKPNSPVEIIDTVPGSGIGNINGRIGFDPRRQFNRTGLALSHGIVYVCFSAHCDWNPSHGWIMGFDAGSLQLRISYITTPADGRGGIWMSGAAPALDAAGNVFVAVGNGQVGEDGFTDMPQDTANRGESVVRLTPNAPDNTATALNITSFFTPQNYLVYDDADLDFGTQALLVPGTSMLVTAVKGKLMYVLDQASLGGFHAGSDSVIQSFPVSSNAQFHSSFAYYGGTSGQWLYQFSENTLLQSYRVGASSLGNPVSGSVSGPTGASGAYMSVSSNGATDSSAILWIAHAVNGCNANQSICQGILRAVRADDVTTELWNSTINPLDNLGNFSKMNCPTIANGKVYVNTFSNQLMVYGLTSNSLCNSYPDVASSVNNPGATYSASSTSGGAPSNAFDGNQSTSWNASATGPGGGDTAEITVNLSARYDICKVVVDWGTNYAKSFTLQGSNDDTVFTDLYMVTGNNSATTSITLSNLSYQYIRMQGVTRSASATGYAINEMEVYGQLTNLCSTPTLLSASNITQNTAMLSWQGFPGATSYLIEYKTPIVSSWISRTTSTTSLNISALSCNTGYTYSIQASCPQGASAQATSTFTTSACTGTCGSLPTRYFNADIGDIGFAGSSCLSNGIYTITGSGTGITGSSDQFQYAFTNLSGDEYMIAQILSQDAADPADQAGLMFRDSISNTSRFIFIGTTSSGGAELAWRSVAGAVATTMTVNGISAPYWVELSKEGSVYKAYISQSGAAGSWTEVGAPTDLGFSNSAYLGMAVSSYNNSLLSQATFGSFTVEGGDLPVTLINFSGINVNNLYAQLNWTTATEVNSSYFDLERSGDGMHFVTIDSLEAAGNSVSPRNYADKDENPMNGHDFYRLKIVNRDGTFAYSNIISLIFGNGTVLQLFPNPAKDYFMVAAGTNPVSVITVLDATGKVIRQLLNQNGSSLITIDTRSLSAGLYFIRITTTAGTDIQKWIKD